MLTDSHIQSLSLSFFLPPPPPFSLSLPTPLSLPPSPERAFSLVVSQWWLVSLVRWLALSSPSSWASSPGKLKPLSVRLGCCWPRPSCFWPLLWHNIDSSTSHGSVGREREREREFGGIPREFACVVCRLYHVVISFPLSPSDVCLLGRVLPLSQLGSCCCNVAG